MSTIGDVTALRLRLRAAGFLCIPLEGKRPPMPQWQLANPNPEEIRLWEKSWHFAHNTGILSKYTPGLDIDIKDEDAAEALEYLAREHFEERGKITTRIGLWPKRLIPLRTDEPFAKLKRTFIPPGGLAPGEKPPAIEVLGDGQQWVTHGIHPDTKAPYRWTHGEPGKDFAREDLPYCRAAEVEQYLDAAATLLIDQHGLTLVTSPSEANGGGGPHEPSAEPLAPSSRVAAAVRVIPNADLDWDEWNRVGMAIWAATNGSAEGFEIFDRWSQKSRKYDARATSKKWSGYVRSPPTRIGFGTLKHLADQADPAWEDALRGEPPPPHPDDPGAQRRGDPQPDPEPPPQPEPPPRKRRFPLKTLENINVSMAPNYLVKGILPRVGLGVVWGPPKCGKSFKTFDLVMHVACAATIAAGPFAKAQWSISPSKAASDLPVASKPGGSATSRPKTPRSSSSTRPSI
jgi:hypothetical protein